MSFDPEDDPNLNGLFDVGMVAETQSTEEPKKISKRKMSKEVVEEAGSPDENIPVTNARSKKTKRLPKSSKRSRKNEKNATKKDAAEPAPAPPASDQPTTTLEKAVSEEEIVILSEPTPETTAVSTPRYQRPALSIQSTPFATRSSHQDIKSHDQPRWVYNAHYEMIQQCIGSMNLILNTLGFDTSMYSVRVTPPHMYVNTADEYYNALQQISYMTEVLIPLEVLVRMHNNTKPNTRIKASQNFRKNLHEVLFKLKNNTYVKPLAELTAYFITCLRL